MAQLNLVEAINRALREELERDPSVLLLGEDVGKEGGVFRVTEGLQQAFGEARAIDTPLAPPPETVFIMLDSKAPWVRLPADAKRTNCYAEYPEDSLADWHRAHGLYDESEPA